MTVHVLRCEEPWFSLVASGKKTAELRHHDRDYQIGDQLLLVQSEWGNQPLEPDRVVYVKATIGHILPASVFPLALQERWSMLSLVNCGAETEVTGEQFLELRQKLGGAR